MHSHRTVFFRLCLSLTQLGGIAFNKGRHDSDHARWALFISTSRSHVRGEIPIIPYMNPHDHTRWSPGDFFFKFSILWDGCKVPQWSYIYTSPSPDRWSFWVAQAVLCWAPGGSLAPEGRSSLREVVQQRGGLSGQPTASWLCWWWFGDDDQHEPHDRTQGLASEGWLNVFNGL